MLTQGPGSTTRATSGKRLRRWPPLKVMMSPRTVRQRAATSRLAPRGASQTQPTTTSSELRRTRPPWTSRERTTRWRCACIRTRTPTIQRQASAFRVSHRRTRFSVTRSCESGMISMGRRLSATRRCPPSTRPSSSTCSLAPSSSRSTLASCTWRCRRTTSRRTFSATWTGGKRLTPPMAASQRAMSLAIPLSVRCVSPQIPRRTRGSSGSRRPVRCAVQRSSVSAWTAGSWAVTRRAS
mmetsp:Transcript_81676/g.189704  ORF Transcript_81676/g.189704 Transcript_81676/m.189704 type:complete len:239 (-) Transcript_81676:690-1406(-)